MPGRRGGGRDVEHGRSTLGSHCPFPCLFLQPSPHPGLLGVTASWQRKEYSCFMSGTSRSRPELCLGENDPGSGEATPQMHTSRAASRPEARASPTLPELLRPLRMVSTLGHPPPIPLQALKTPSHAHTPHTPPGPYARSPHSPHTPSHEGSKTKPLSLTPVAPGHSHCHWS